MQQAKKKPPVKEVQKPFLTGTWNGKDAFRLARKLFFNTLVVTLMYLLLSMMLSFEGLIWRVLTSLALVGLAAGFLYSQGLQSGQTDVAFGEIMHLRKAEGKPIEASDLSRCYHPAKGFFSALIGALPFVLIALIFAVLTKPVEYTLGVLPSWVSGFMRQSEFGDALAYYQVPTVFSLVDGLRIAVRAMVMPFVTVAVKLGDTAVLWVERLSPLLVLVAPMAFGLGYRNGTKIRTRINTGIVIGDSKKKRKERKERKQRAQGKAPERLI